MVRVDGRPPLGAQRPADSAGDHDVKFAVEVFRPDVIPAWMLNDHYQEMANLREVFARPVLDHKTYDERQRQGRFIFVTARVKGDDYSAFGEPTELVGYVALFLQPHPHYRDVIQAAADAHYLLPALRDRGVGSAMLAFAEHEAAKRGAQVFVMRDKWGHAHTSMWERLGYAPDSIAYVKDIRNAQKLAE